MAQRETAANASRKSRARKPASDAQKAAGRANLEKGRKRKAELAEKAAQESRPRARDRWAKLLDGSLTVRDLDDAEVRKMSVRGADGSISGRSRTLPSHLAQEFHREAIRRANDKIRTAAPEAVQALLDIGRDPDVKESDRVRALMYVVDRALGKTPETIRVEGASPFDAMLRDAVDVDREVADVAREEG